MVATTDGAAQPDWTTQTDEQLAALAAREESAGPAFNELLRRFQPRVWSTCYRLMSHSEDAADAAQEVCLRLFLQRQRFAGRSRYSTWVYGVAVRTCLFLRRGRGRRRKRETIADSEAVWSGATEREGAAAGTRLDLEQMLAILDEEDRAILVMKYAEGHSHEELAEIFELSESATKMRISRAREKLKQRFGVDME
ncbi:MAG: RNA polymerase sigma factor [Pirellulales bacterium]|nr:RNA polymerase sigma factor [Pirellulales bacterium]